MTNMPIQYFQIPSGLSQQDSHGNTSFTNAYSPPPYPLTPYPTVPETENLSPFALVHTTEPETERRARTHSYAPSPSDLCHSSPTLSWNISSTELQRVLDSLLDQVDWLEVAVRVAENRAPSIYCNAVEKILLAHIYRLVKAEGEDAASFENGNDDKEYVYVYESDDEDEVRSEASKESEDEDGDGDEDDNEDMERDEDEQDDEDNDDDMNDDEYDEENVSDSV